MTPQHPAPHAITREIGGLVRRARALIGTDEPAARAALLADKTALLARIQDTADSPAGGGVR